VRDDDVLLKVLRGYGDVKLIDVKGQRPNYYVEVERTPVWSGRSPKGQILPPPPEAVYLRFGGQIATMTSIGVWVKHSFDPKYSGRISVGAFFDREDVVYHPEHELERAIKRREEGRDAEVMPDEQTWRRLIRAAEKVRVKIREDLRQKLTPDAVLALLQYVGTIPEVEDLLDKPIQYIGQDTNGQEYVGVIDRVVIYNNIATLKRHLKRGVIKHPEEYFSARVEGTMDGKAAEPIVAVKGQELQSPFNRNLTAWKAQIAKVTAAQAAVMQTSWRLAAAAQTILAERIETLKTMLLRVKDELREELFERYSSYFGRSKDKPFWFPKKEELE